MAPKMKAERSVGGEVFNKTFIVCEENDNGTSRSSHIGVGRTANLKCSDSDINQPPYKKLKTYSSGEVKWDVSTELTAEILQDMGVAVLDDFSCDSVLAPEPTPPVTAINARLPPKAPRVYGIQDSSFKDNINNNRNSVSGNADDFILFKRCKSVGPLGKNHFTKLSDEILLYIFKWLPKSVLARCAQVCKRWKRLSYDESLWKRLDLSHRYLHSGVLGRVLNKGVIILRLAMSEINGPLYVDFSSALKLESHQRFSKLQYLDLSMSCISASTLSELLSACSQLKKLSLEYCPVTDSICRHIAKNCDLETLNMTMCEGLTSCGLYDIATSCQRLKSWNLAWTHLSLECLRSLVRNLPSSLQRLNLSGCRNTLIDEFVSALVHQCSDLIEVDFSDATLLTGSSIEFILTGLPSLVHLHISRCYGINPAYYLMLAKHSNLKYLELFGALSDFALQTLRHSLPNIDINKHLFSTIARPTTGIRRSTIWGLRVRY